ncbi:MAG: hypothetical protein ACD_16C00243G0001, partial [uncultured bacterium]
IESKRELWESRLGPRQVGKTTLALQLKQVLPYPSHYASADEPLLRNLTWIEQQWEIGRLRARESINNEGALLILDEVQKIPRWSDMVKKLWDEDRLHAVNLRVIILGSSTLLVQLGLTESLAGRFEVIPITHWFFKECRDAFGWSLDQYIFFGGYPGGAPLIHDEKRWAHYIVNSLIEISILKDIVLMERIHKPALLRYVFELGCQYSGQILSFQKMMGQLQEAGNPSTLAHYLNLLSGAGLVTGLSKFSFEPVRQKASSPKLQVFNTALITAQKGISFQEAQEDREEWGRLVESAVGAYLVNSTLGTSIELFYWREGNKEVDFILRHGKKLLALEVKSSKKPTSLPGMSLFSERYHPQKKLLVGGQGLSVEEFLLTPLEILMG